MKVFQLTEIGDDGGHSDNNVVEDLGDAGGSDVASADLSLKLDGKGGGGREDGHGAEGEGGKGGNVLEGEHFEKNVGVCSTERGLRVQKLDSTVDEDEPLCRASLYTRRSSVRHQHPQARVFALPVREPPAHRARRQFSVEEASAHGNKSAVARDR